MLLEPNVATVVYRPHTPVSYYLPLVFAAIPSRHTLKTRRQGCAPYRLPGYNQTAYTPSLRTACSFSVGFTGELTPYTQLPSQLADTHHTAFPPFADARAGCASEAAICVYTSSVAQPQTPGPRAAPYNECSAHPSQYTRPIGGEPGRGVVAWRRPRLVACSPISCR